MTGPADARELTTTVIKRTIELAEIPAPTGTRGEGEHTPGEWTETAPITDGLTALADTIHLFREGRA